MNFLWKILYILTISLLIHYYQSYHTSETKIIFPANNKGATSRSSFRNTLLQKIKLQANYPPKNNNNNVPPPVPDGSTLSPLLRAPTNLTVHWLIASTCCGLQIEALHLIYAFRKLGAHVTVQDKVTYCDGNPPYITKMLQEIDKERFPVRRPKRRRHFTYDVLICHTCWHGKFGAISSFFIPHFKYFVIRSMWDSTGLPLDNRALLDRADEIWVPSEFNIDSYQKNGIPKEKLFKLEETIDTEIFSPHSASKLNLSNIHPRLTFLRKNSYNFLFVSRLALRKNWDGLITTYLREFDNTTDVTLFIFEGSGKVSGREDIYHLISKIPVTRRPIIELINEGSYTTEDMVYLYSQMDCFVFPTHGEGWGLPVMEAMSMELPVIVTAFGGSTEFSAPESSNQENSTFFGGWGVKYSEYEAAYPEEKWEGVGLWPTPDEGHLSRIMRYAYEHPEEGRRRGKAGREHVLKYYTHDSLGATGVQHLHRVSQKVALGQYSNFSKEMHLHLIQLEDQWEAIARNQSMAENAKKEASEKLAQEFAQM